MFRAPICSSSGESIESILHLAYVTLKASEWSEITILDHSLVFRVTYTRCRIDAIDSPDDEHMGARNMERIEINIREKELCVKMVIYKNYTKMNGQQNIKYV